MRRARVCQVYDGDSITVCVRIHGKYRRLQCRVADVDAAELNGVTAAKGREARSTLLKHLRIRGDSTLEYKPSFFNQTAFYVDLKCGKNDKYGRVLVYVRPSRTILRFGRYINTDLLDDKNFNKYTGGKKLSFGS